MLLKEADRKSGVEWDKQWEPLIDRAKLETFRKHYDSLMRRADALRDERVGHLLKWLQAPLWLDTLEDYDKNDARQAALFEALVTDAIFGINGTRQGQKKLDEWVKDMQANQRKNMVWRTIALNQTELATAVQQTLDKAMSSFSVNFSAADFDTAIRHLSALKAASDTYKKVASFSAANAKASAGNAELHGVKVNSSKGLLLDKFMMTVGPTIYSVTGIGRAADSVGEIVIRHLLNLRALVAPDNSAAFLKAEVDARVNIRVEAEKEAVRRASSQSRQRLEAQRADMTPEQTKRLEQMNQRAEKARTGQTYEQRVAKIESDQNKAVLAMELQAQARLDQKSAVHKNWRDFISNASNVDTATQAASDVRLAVVVGLIEIANLAKLVAWDTHQNGTSIELGASMFASVLTISGASLDMAATVAKGLHGESNLHQRLKLMGGAAGAIAGGIGVLVDGMQASKEFDRGRATMGWLYGGKAFLGFISTATTVALTVGNSAPFVAGATGRTALYARTAQGVSGLATHLISARVLFMSVGMWITFLSVGVHLLIIWLDDDELTKWCQRCTFSRWQDKAPAPPYLSVEQQTRAFHAALLEVAM